LILAFGFGFASPKSDFSAPHSAAQGKRSRQTAASKKNSGTEAAKFRRPLHLQQTPISNTENKKFGHLIYSL